MKSGLLLIALLLQSSSVLAAPAACEEAQKRILPPRDLSVLIDLVCGPYKHDWDAPQDQTPKTPRERLVYEYTDNCYKEMNPALRSEKPNPKALEASLQLDAVLCDYPIHAGQVYRGAKLSAEQIEVYRVAKKKNEPVVMNAFTSTSQNQATACGFAKTVIFLIASKTGRVIIDQAKTRDEQEVLFRLNTEFKVLNVSGDTDEMKQKTNCVMPWNLIELEEV